MKCLSRDPINEYCDLLDRIARIEHEQWVHWIKYQHDESNEEKLARWLQLAETPYDKLSTEEKRSDIQWARKVLNEIPKLCPMLEHLRKMIQCHECPWYKRCLKKLNKTVKE